MIVAIDGGVASGKSAVGRRVAKELGLPFVDSGLMYRAISRLVVQRGLDPHDAPALTSLAGSTEIRIEDEHVWVDGHDMTAGIFGTDYSDVLPIVSATPGVRDALVKQQRAAPADGIVMAGRDIGTVVFPDADFKFFLTASLDEKVRRRSAQYERRGETVDAAAMRREVELRDRADTERVVAPLRPADDAVIVDTDDLDLDQVVAVIVEHVRKGARLT